MESRKGRKRLTDEERRARYLQRLEARRVFTAVRKNLEGWTVVAEVAASNGYSMHTIEQNGNEFRCTCQGFKIHKKGTCRHIDDIRSHVQY